MSKEWDFGRLVCGGCLVLQDTDTAFMLSAFCARERVDKSALRRHLQSVACEGGTVVDMSGSGSLLVMSACLGYGVICETHFLPLLSPPTLEEVKERLRDYEPALGLRWQGDEDALFLNYLHPQTLSELRAALNFLEIYKRTPVDEWIRMCILMQIGLLGKTVYYSIRDIVLQKTRRLLRLATTTTRERLRAAVAAPRAWPVAVFLRWPKQCRGPIFDWFAGTDTETDLLDNACSYCVPVIVSVPTRKHCRLLLAEADRRRLLATPMEPIYDGGFTFRLTH